MEKLELGKHYLIELVDCRHEVIDDESTLRSALLKAVTLSGAKIIKDVFHKFAPQGVTGVIVISESHVAVHTWPEHNYVACDVFTCTSRMKVDLFISEFKKSIGAAEVFISEVPRGPRR